MANEVGGRVIPTSVAGIEVAAAGFEWREGRAHYAVVLKITNRSKRILQLDKPSVAAKGELSNDLFEVRADGRAVDYHGMMAKRAPPSSFVQLAPGKTFVTRVELGDAYPLTAGVASVTVRYRHHNHFSPDDWDLESNEVTFVVPSVSLQAPPQAPPR